MAIVTAGVVAQEPAAEQEAGKPFCQYLATMLRPQARSSLAADRQQPGRFDRYRAVCFVGADSALQGVGDLERALHEKRAQLLFVDPLSVSGKIAPQHALRAF